MSDTFEVTIWGPNLHIEGGPTFHVHRPGCPDTKRGAYRNAEQPWTVTVASKRALTIEIYSYVMSDSYNAEQIASGDAWREGYEQDIKVYPCVGDLPEEVEVRDESDGYGVPPAGGFGMDEQASTDAGVAALQANEPALTNQRVLDVVTAWAGEAVHEDGAEESGVNIAVTLATELLDLAIDAGYGTQFFDSSKFAIVLRPRVKS